MSPNIQEVEAAARKRSHDNYLVDGTMIENAQAAAKKPAPASILSMFNKQQHVKLPPVCGSNPDSVTEPVLPATDTLPLSPKSSNANSHSISQPMATAPAAHTTAGPPALKRTKLTPTEKEAREKESKQRADIKAAEKKAKEEAKAAEEAKKAEARKQKAEARAQAEAERAAKAQERAEKKRIKEEEERKVQEEKERKARAQPKIASFFKMGPSTPVNKPENGAATVPSAPSPADASPAKAPVQESEYDRIFRPFHIKSHVTMAKNHFAMDEETKAAKSRILDEYIRGERPPVDLKTFNPIEVFRLPDRPRPRGRHYRPVRKIMSQIYEDGGSFTTPVDLAESAKTSSESAKEELRSIPIKTLRFWEDVRPPYRGTITSQPCEVLQKLAKRPVSRLLPLNYDYDSELEWQQGDDEGEDLDDLTDDEDDAGEDEDMAEFLDDSEDVGPARQAYSSDMKPISTGICFEDHNSLGPCTTVYKHRLEFILPLDSHYGVDPFSTQYWEEGKSKSANTSPMGAKKTSSTSGGNSLGNELKDVSKGSLDKIIAGIVKYKHATKAGLIEMLSVEVADVNRNKLKAVVALIAERNGPPVGNVKKTWKLKPQYMSMGSDESKG